MKQKTLEYLESLQSDTPSQWREEAEWRRVNRDKIRIDVQLLLSNKQEHQTQSYSAKFE
jgi:hypothetical protein